MQRRSFLSTLGLAAAAAACPLCQIGGAKAADWGYAGEAGPERWGGLTPDFRTCSIGTQQTPVDLRGTVKAQLGDIAFDYRPAKAKVINNGHTIQANMPEGSTITLNAKRFALLQFHFHHPSEHLLAGKALPMELHFVHRGDDGELAVVGVFLKEGKVDNTALAPLWAAMPMKSGGHGPTPVAVEGAHDEGTDVAPADLLPTDRAYYRYNGSLTTPPCTEGINWVVFRQPVEIGPSQLAKFAGLFPMNARPVQDLNRRFLLESL